MPSKSGLTEAQLVALQRIYQAGDVGWDGPPLGSLKRGTTLNCLVRRGLIQEQLPGHYVANRGAAARRLWDALLVPVDAEFLQDILGLVGEDRGLAEIEGWNTEQRRDVWSWASAEHLGASGAGGRRLPRPRVLDIEHWGAPHVD